MIYIIVRTIFKSASLFKVTYLNSISTFNIRELCSFISWWLRSQSIKPNKYPPEGGVYNPATRGHKLIKNLPPLRGVDLPAALRPGNRKGSNAPLINSALVNLFDNRMTGKKNASDIRGINFLTSIRWFSLSNLSRDENNNKDKLNKSYLHAEDIRDTTSNSLDINKGRVDTSKAIIKYSNVLTSSKEIKAFIRNKSGIYMWKNIINNKEYVGSSLKLNRRFTEYMNVKRISKLKNMAINEALLKYGYENFNFYILEFCDKSKLHEREKFYIDQITKGYNILKIPGSPSRISGWKHTSSTKDILSTLASKRVKDPAHIAIAQLSQPTMVSVQIVDVLKNKITNYDSLRGAERALKNTDKTIKIYRSLFTSNRYTDINNLYKDRYYFILGTPSVIKENKKQSKYEGIIVTDLKTNITQEFLSIKDIAETYDLNYISVGNYIRKNVSYPFLNRFIIIPGTPKNKA
jgi:hypothetical protein